jgi:hypothetical protein
MILRPDSCPTVSPLPSSLDLDHLSTFANVRMFEGFVYQPDPADSSLPSQSWSSEALMLTSSLNSLLIFRRVSGRVLLGGDSLDDGVVIFDHFELQLVGWFRIVFGCRKKLYLGI